MIACSDKTILRLLAISRNIVLFSQRIFRFLANVMYCLDLMAPDQQKKYLVCINHFSQIRLSMLSVLTNRLKFVLLALIAKKTWLCVTPILFCATAWLKIFLCSCVNDRVCMGPLACNKLLLYNCTTGHPKFLLQCMGYFLLISNFCKYCDWDY